MPRSGGLLPVEWFCVLDGRIARNTPEGLARRSFWVRLGYHFGAAPGSHRGVWRTRLPADGLYGVNVRIGPLRECLTLLVHWRGRVDAFADPNAPVTMAGLARMARRFGLSLTSDRITPEREEGVCEGCGGIGCSACEYAGRV